MTRGRTPGRDRGWGLAIPAGLAALTLLSYLPVFRNGFILPYDDGDYLASNPVVAAGLTLEGVRWAFTTFTAGNWHPVTWLSHMLDVSLFGLDPRGHHAVGLAFHAANGLLLHRFLSASTGRPLRSAFVSALFLLHPLHVESVAWAAERKDLLCAFFFLLTLLAWRSFALRRTAGRYLLVLLLFALALLSKPMAVTLPFVLLLLDAWPLGRFAPPEGEEAGSESASLRTRRVRLVVEKAPLFLLSAASCVVTWLAQRASDSIVPLRDAPVWYRLLNALVSCGKYLWYMVFPLRLAVFYPHPGNDGAAAAVSWGVGTAIFLAAGGACAWRRRREAPYLWVGLAWYLGMLVPVLGLVQVGAQAMADRYSYLPLVGPFVAATWAAGDAMERFPRARAAAAAAAVLLLLALGGLTRVQAAYWRDGLTLFRRAVEVTGNNGVAHAVLGIELGRRRDYAAALPHLEEAARINPASWRLQYDLAHVLHRLGRDGEAALHLAVSLRLNPGRPEPGRLWAEMSGESAEESDGELGSLEAEAARRTGDAGARNDLGVALSELGRRREAMVLYREALRLDPDHADAHFNLAVDLEAEGELAEAARHYAEVLRVRPADREAAARLEAVRTTGGAVPER